MSLIVHAVNCVGTVSCAQCWHEAIVGLHCLESQRHADVMRWKHNACQISLSRDPFRNNEDERLRQAIEHLADPASCASTGLAGLEANGLALVMQDTAESAITSVWSKNQPEVCVKRTSHNVMGLSGSGLVRPRGCYLLAC